MTSLDEQMEGLILRLKQAETDNVILKSIVKQYELMEKDYEALIELHRANN